MGWWRSGMTRCALGSVPRLVASACFLFAPLLGPLRPGMEVLAASAPAAPTIPAKVDCGALVQNGSSGPAGSAQSGVPDFSEIADFPTRITSANVVAAAGQAPEFCDVLGYIQPQIHFELKLPTTTWQGRYLQQGCSGFCGSINPTSFPACDQQLGGDFALAATDDGHTARNAFDGGWAAQDEQLRTDFDFRAVHGLAVVSRAIIAAFYGQAPSHM